MHARLAVTGGRVRGAWRQALAGAVVFLWVASVATADWSAVAQACREAGIPGERVEAVARLCEARGLDDRAREELLLPVLAAPAAGVDSAVIMAKVEEGLSKGVEPAVIASAAQQRLTCMVRAREMVRRVSGEDCPWEPELALATGYLLESGLRESDVEVVLAEGGQRYRGRLVTILQGGEALHLAGVEDDAVRAFMLDCMERNLRPMEVRRAARYMETQVRRGTSGADARQALWSGDGAGGAKEAHRWGWGGAGEPGPHRNRQVESERVGGPALQQNGAPAPGANQEASRSGAGADAMPAGGTQAGSGASAGSGAPDGAGENGQHNQGADAPGDRERGR